MIIILSDKAHKAYQTLRNMSRGDCIILLYTSMGYNTCGKQANQTANIREDILKEVCIYEYELICLYHVQQAGARWNLGVS